MSNNDEKYNEDYQAANETLIKRETMKLERARDRAQALEVNMAKGLAAALKAQKSSLAKEASRAVNKQESGNLSDNERRMIEAAQKGFDTVKIDEGVITGFDMPSSLRGWDDDDNV